MINKLQLTLLAILVSVGISSHQANAQYVGLYGNLESIRNNDTPGNGSLLSTGTIFSVGSFGNRTAAQVDALFSGATDSASFGSLLQANYISAFTQSTSTLGVALGDNTNNYSYAANLPGGITASDYIYAVFAQATGNGDYRMGIFGAATYNGSGVAGSQIRFNLTELGSNLMNLTTDYADTTGGPGAIAVGNGSLGGVSSNGFFLGTAVSNTAPIPEPSAASLIVLGGSALVALRRLRKNV